jgi:2-deoxy-D-gluconate 3-dehydrogenase
MTQEQGSPHLQPLRPWGDLFKLQGKTAIVTGGALGIGFGIARRLAEAGANVVVADVKEAAGKAAAARLTEEGAKAILVVPCDVSSEQQTIAAVKRTVDRFGGLDILVNNAGIYPFTPALQMTEQQFMRVIDINLKGAFLMAREAAKQMAAQGRGGAIVNIASIDSLRPSSIGLAHYDSSKGGMLMLTKNLALEFAQYGIRVNAVAPGGIATEGAAAGALNMTPEQQQAMTEAFLAKIPLRRMGTPDEIATMTLFLASEAASYMTGELVVIDGGALLA